VVDAVRDLAAGAAEDGELISAVRRAPAEAPDFDPIARAYRWMEYGSLGNLLERTRFAHLDAGRLDGARRALVLGDGDGRFTARLLRRNRAVRVTAVDASAEMLGLLRKRCAGDAGRLEARLGDAREFGPAERADLVATHFFLDCLEQGEVESLVARVVGAMERDGRWVVSEFRVPEGWLRWPAAMLVRGLYLAFRVLTGLRVTRLPDHAGALRKAGMALTAERRLLAGVLTTQVWQRVGSGDLTAGLAE
jgi:SAM-dependent methyltransferase